MRITPPRKRSGRPRRSGPARRFNLTLDEPDALLLEAYAQEVGLPPTRVAGDLFRALLHNGRGADGRVDQAQIAAMLRTIRGEMSQTPLSPRWEWPIEAILADGRWWDRWLPDLNELLGRDLTPARAGGIGTREEPVVDRRGYSDLCGFLFPDTDSPRGLITWRSPEYPQLAGISPHIWQSVIRHVARALSALEVGSELKADPLTGIRTQDEIRHGWLDTLLSLVGESPPKALPKKRLSP